MIKTTQEDLLYLSSSFSRMVKRRFGKGPEACHIVSKGPRLYVYMRNFITPAEEVLLDKNELQLAASFRTVVISAVAEEFAVESSKVLGVTYHSYYHDWNYDTNTGILLLESMDDADEGNMEVFFEEELFKMIEKVSSGYHKRPNSIKIIKHSQNTCVLEAKGVLFQLKKFLYEKGDKELLYHHLRVVKNGYLEQKISFEGIFNRKIEDMFIICDYTNDRSYLIFNFNKENLIN